MLKQQLYYDYVCDQLVPCKFVLTFDYQEIDWNKKAYYFDLIKPFEYYDYDNYDENVISFSVYLTDLIVNNLRPGQLGINLTSLKSRIEKYGLDHDLVRQFVMFIPDVSEVLQLIPNERKMAFVANN